MTAAFGSLYVLYLALTHSFTLHRCVIGALLVSLFLPDFRASTEDELAEAEEKRRVASTSAQHSAPLPAHSRAMSADGGAEVHGSVLASN